MLGVMRTAMFPGDERLLFVCMCFCVQCYYEKVVRIWLKQYIYELVFYYFNTLAHTYEVEILRQILFIIEIVILRKSSLAESFNIC